MVLCHVNFDLCFLCSLLFRNLGSSGSICGSQCFQSSLPAGIQIHVNPRHQILSGVLLSCLLAGAAFGAKIAPQKYLLGKEHPGVWLPYKGSHPLDQVNPDITRIFFSIHSSGYDALQYYGNAEAAIAKVPGGKKETLIVAPHFLDPQHIEGKIPDKMLHWKVRPYWGSSLGLVGSEGKAIRLSSFDVLDQWIAQMADRKLYPNLKDVVIVGHSAGGQMVQRYALVGKFQPPEGVKIRYVVCAPSSYAYPTAERWVPGTKYRFAVPSGNQLESAPNYNNWGYGMKEPYTYFRGMDPKKVAQEYAKRRVFYICGEKDNDPNNRSLSKSNASMLQGKQRLERMTIFFQYLQHTYGPSITQTHAFAIAPRVGHSGKGNMTSSPGMRFLFAPLPE